MSFAEDMLVAHLEQKAPARPSVKPLIIMSTTGLATGSMWLGLDTMRGPFSSSRRANEIIRAVRFVTGVSQMDFLGHRRWRHCAESRQIAYWFMRHYTKLSTTQIGHFVGNRDHATVLHGIRRVNSRPRLFGPRIVAIAGVLNVPLPEGMPFQ
jgi:hypothetical protein